MFLIKICKNKDLLNYNIYKEILKSFDIKELQNLKNKLEILEKTNQISFLEYLKIYTLLSDIIETKN